MKKKDLLRQGARLLAVATTLGSGVELLAQEGENANNANAAAQAPENKPEAPLPLTPEQIKNNPLIQKLDTSLTEEQKAKREWDDLLIEEKLERMSQDAIDAMNNYSVTDPQDGITIMNFQRAFQIQWNMEIMKELKRIKNEYERLSKDGKTPSNEQMNQARNWLQETGNTFWKPANGLMFKKYNDAMDLFKKLPGPDGKPANNSVP